MRNSDVFVELFSGVIARLKPGVDGEVFIAIEVGDNVGAFWLVDNQTFPRVQMNDVILACRRILSGDKALV